MKKKTQFQSSLKIPCNISNCIHHGHKITDEYTGEIVCDACGVVLEEKILSYKIYEKDVVVL